MRLIPGTYQAEIRDNQVSGGRTPVVYLEEIVIEEGKTVERSADFSDGRLRLVTLRNGMPQEASVFYFREGGTKAFHNEATHPQTGQIESCCRENTPSRSLTTESSGNPQ